MVIIGFPSSPEQHSATVILNHVIPWFVTWWLTTLPTTKLSVSFQLYRTFLHPDNFIESVVMVLLGPLETLRFVCGCISWQYLLPRNVQPSEVRQCNIVRREITLPLLISDECSWYVVVSSSKRIWFSTMCQTSSLIFDRLPGPADLPILPVLR